MTKRKQSTNGETAMTNEELERGFDEAREQWNDKNVKQVDNDYELRRLARYFFWAGSTFGVQVTKPNLRWQSQSTAGESE